MKAQITLSSKEVRAIIAKALNLPLEKVIPLRYGFAIDGVPLTELQKKMAEIGCSEFS